MANGGTDFYTDADDPFTVATTPSDMTAGLEQYGLTHNGTSVIFLTETTLLEVIVFQSEDVITTSGEEYEEERV